jgi:hypothetical protein
MKRICFQEDFILSVDGKSWAESCVIWLLLLYCRSLFTFSISAIENTLKSPLRLAVSQKCRTVRKDSVTTLEWPGIRTLIPLIRPNAGIRTHYCRFVE